MRKKLSKFFITAAARKTSENPSTVEAPAAELATLKKRFHPHCAVARPDSKPRKVSPCVSPQVLQRLKKAASRNSIESANPVENSAVQISREICTILQGNNDIVDPPSPEPNDGMLLKNILDIPWFSNMSEISTSQRRKEVSRERKQKYIFKNTESRRFTKLMKMCVDKLGTESTLEVFGRLGRETGIKEYNALIKLCISKARQSDEEGSLVQIHKAYQLFVSMRERGFQIEEESYAPLLLYMIDMRMKQEFQTCSELIKEENPGSYSRIGYYEMLLWIRVGDEDKIRELCDSVEVASSEDSYNLAESYLLAFCDSDREVELLQLLDVLDIRRISSLAYVASIFKSLGRLQLENFSKKFILQLKSAGAREENASSFIYDYATSIPNLVVEEITSKFRNLHEQLGVLPSVVSCNMLVKLCCNSFKVHAAIDVINHMCQSHLDVPVESFHPLLHACEQNCEFDMVRPIYSMMRRHNVKPNVDTFKSMISLSVRMKDFEGAYNLLTDAEEKNEIPTASMYNAIMAGYFREKNNKGALMVLKQMEDADVKPDSETYGYLIANCECEKDLIKYRDETQLAGLQVTKHVYMALINAYAKFGNFEMAKQVVLDCDVPSKYLNDLKGVLVGALSSNGQISDALTLFDEMKSAGCSVEPKAIINLIEHLQSEGALERLLQLLEELNNSSYWFDGCSRVILYCVHYNLASSAIVLLKKLKQKDESSTYIVIDQIFNQIWKTPPTNLETGMNLLQAIKELHLHPSRTSLDFLLSSCVKAKDSDRAWLVWSEYEDAGLSYNVLTFLRMYQALLASGQLKAASKILKSIPKDDPHVCYVVNACKRMYTKSSSERGREMMD